MTKRELIDEITHLNTSASPAFLAGFADDDLSAYLRRLRRIWARPGAPQTAPEAQDGSPTPAPADNYPQEKPLQPALF